MFADMEPLGENPARIIPAWHEFVDTSGPRRAVRGIGEPIHAGLTPDQLVEAQLHERLLNLAFGEGTALRLLCPYGSGLDPAVLEEARHAHPFALRRHGPLVDQCDHDWTRTAPALVEPERVDVVFPYDRAGLASLRDAVRDLAVDAGVPDERVESLVVAVSEIGTNSILHGGGHGVPARVALRADAWCASSTTPGGSPTRWRAAADPRRRGQRSRAVARQPVLRPGAATHEPGARHDRPPPRGARRAALRRPRRGATRRVGTPGTRDGSAVARRCARAPRRE